MADNNNQTTKYEIDIIPKTFKSLQNKMRTDTDELASSVSSIFSKIFHDYVGCRVKYQKTINIPNSGTIDIFDTMLVFRDNTSPIPDGMIKATKNLVSINQEESSNNNNDDNESSIDYLDVINVFNSRSKGEIFTLTQEAKEIILQFMGPKVNLGNIDKYINQTIESSRNPLYPTNTEVISVVISGLDIYKILKKIYGNKMIVSCSKHGDDYNAEFSQCDYRLEFEKYKPGTNGQECIVSINQYSPIIGEERLIKENSNLIFTDRIIFH